MSMGHALLVPGVGAKYTKRIQNLFGNAIIGYYVGGEPNGAVAIDDSGRGFNGAYTGVTLGQPGIGDGLTCPLYDGANDYMQPPAGFRTALNGQLFSILLWAAVSSTAVWEDGTSDSFVRFEVDVNNFTYIRKNTVANGLRFQYSANATSKFVTDTSLNGSLAFFHAAMTVDLVADQMKAYLNGIQIGTTQTGLGTFVGAFDPNRVVIGATSITPQEPTNGRLQHICVLNRAATPAEVAAAAVI